ncbi:hypothetical protein JOF56_001778 [Kibdelosporangium banguiense]|uniref:Uncharacterized protein n=1 Tax=Kibdelosporangium banguiense TaxID=1365924 RepID=A0ABS4TAE1_9PSEU|nr:hypothetical protein [Kibdelosporangium banguiense]MBP2321393.1 hypothetical protein [Kibdelosporangium banguiense]
MSVYLSDRDSIIVQGSKVTDEEALAELRKRGLPAHETAVEIPRSLLPYFPKATWRNRVARLFGRSKDTA